MKNISTVMKEILSILPFSVAKSFVFTLLGIAKDDGLIDSVNDPITKYIPELADKDSRYTAIIINHLLTMTSDLKYGKEGTFLVMITKTYYNPNLCAVAISAVIEEQPD